LFAGISEEIVKLRIWGSCCNHVPGVFEEIVKLRMRVCEISEQIVKLRMQAFVVTFCLKFLG